MTSSSALTPTFQPFRPTDVGWVAYHDVEPAVGVPGLAMTWRAPDGGLRYAAAFDRQREGYVTVYGRLSDERQDVTELLSAALRKHSSTSDTISLRLLLPHAEEKAGTNAASGLPPVDTHIEIARRAVAEATLTPAMRAAFTTCLDHGVPTLSLTDLRRKTRSTAWPALSLAVTDPTLVGMVMSCEPSIMTLADPMEAIRQRWPGLSGAHLKRLRNVEGPSRGSSALAGRGITRSCLDLLSDCPIDWWPGAVTWDAFAACAYTLQQIRNIHGDVTMRSLAEPSKGDWSGFAKSLGRACGLADGRAGLQNLMLRGQDCRDPVRSLANELLLPLMASHQDEETIARLDEYAETGRPQLISKDEDPIVNAAFLAASRLLYGDKSARAILETSQKWHTCQDAMASEVRGDNGDTNWPPLFEGVFRSGDVGIVSIGNYGMLRDEGGKDADADGVLGLDHCVATRLQQCLSGRSHILSIRLYERDGSWQRLSTCEVSVTQTESASVLISVDEHRGRGNVEPSPEAIAAITHLHEALVKGQISASEEAVRPRTITRGLASLCGYDWREPSAIANTMRVWLPFMPRWARNLDLEDFHQVLIDREILPAPDTDLRPVAP